MEGLTSTGHKNPRPHYRVKISSLPRLVEWHLPFVGNHLPSVGFRSEIKIFAPILSSNQEQHERRRL